MQVSIADLHNHDRRPKRKNPLTAPSVGLADATWYGSFRGGIEMGGGEDAKFKDSGSRWGVKGSNEVSEGLTAVYRYETGIDLGSAKLPSNGRLSYVGLSGGFGTFTAGQIWSASYNHVGVITDNSNYYGSSHTSYRHGNALSYAFSSGALGFQVDLISDGSMDTGNAVDMTEFGMTVGLGDFGKVAVAHTDKRDTKKIDPVSYWADTTASRANTDAEFDPTVEAWKIKVTVAKNHADVTDGKLTATNNIQGAGDKYRIGDDASCNADDATAADACIETDAYYYRTTATATGGMVSTTDNFRLENAIRKAGGNSVVDENGYKATHVAFEAGLGGVTAYVGYSQETENNKKVALKKNTEKMVDAKTKTTHFGVRGGLGDTGISMLVQARRVKNPDGTKTSPWLVGMSKNLGGGASVNFEHGDSDDDKSGKTRLALRVDF